MHQFRVCLRAKGPYALFTRPETKVERVSYDVITPTAAQGLIESIFWKPEIEWHIRQIKVLKPIRFVSVRRNEVKTGFPTLIGGDPPALDTTASRIQRHSLLLSDVDYVLDATLVLSKKGLETEQQIIKYMEMFQRRLRKGQYFRVPNFGCREFVADVSCDTDNVEALNEDRVLGMMPLRMNWTENGPEPIFFAARMINGVIAVPEWK